jgi:hypothetical protein
MTTLAGAAVEGADAGLGTSSLEPVVESPTVPQMISWSRSDWCAVGGSTEEGPCPPAARLRHGIVAARRDAFAEPGDPGLRPS